MAVLANNAEGGALGVTPTAGNSGGASGDAFDSVVVGSGATCTYDDEHAFGTRSYKMFSSGPLHPDEHVHAYWNIAATTAGYGRTYLWLPSLPSGDSCTILIALQGTSRTFAVSVSTSGRVQIRDRDNDVVATSSGSVSTGKWIRLEWFCRTGFGKRVEVRYFNTATSSTQSGSVATSAIDVTSTFTSVTYGCSAYGDPFTLWQDQLGFSTQGWMGPVRNVVVLGQAVESDVAQTVGQPFYRVGQATETDTAFEVRPGRGIPVGQASETDSAQAVTPLKRGKVGLAAETDVALPITPFLYGPGWNPKVIEIRLFDAAGNQDVFAPDWVKIDFTSLFSQEGVVTVDYPPGGLNYDRLADPETEGALFLNNVEVDGSRFLVVEKTGDVIKPDTVHSIAGKTWVSRLKEILVYPPNWPTTTPKDYTFTNATVGEIMSALLLAAQDRNVDAADKTTWTFTNGADSAGQAWDKQATVTFKAGTDLFDVLKSLSNLGMCDFTTKGRQLYVTKSGGIGTNRAVGANPVVLFRGRDFSDAPVNWTTKELISTCLVEGDDGQLVEVVDGTAVTQWARREGYASQSGVSDGATLGIIGQSTIDINDHKREERSHELTFDTSGFLALWDYFVGDTVAVDTEGTQAAYRVMQIRITWSDKGDQTGGVTLNDRFEDLAVKLQRQIDGFGGVVVSSAPSPGTGGPDTTVPKAPTDLLATATVYQGGGGYPLVQFVASWAAVTQNTDNSALTDLDRYEVQSKLSSSSYWGQAASADTATAVYLYGFTSGLSYDFRVRAVDQNENKSAWSSTVTTVAPFDTNAPEPPSAPTVSTYLGTLRVTWNGLDELGGAQAADFRHVEVHVSTVNAFTPSSSTLVDYLPGAGTSVIGDLPYGTPHYVRLVAVDTSGNRSDPSAQGTGTPEQVVQTDIAGNVIGLEHIQFKDATNHIPDGSFETSERRSAVLTGQNTSIWSFVNTGAGHGSWALRGAASVSPSTLRLIPMTPTGSGGVELPVAPSSNLYCRMMYKGDTSPTGGVGMRIVWRDAAGATTNADVLTGSTGTGTWTTIDAQATSPSDAVSYSVWLFVNASATTGFWYFDRVEVRDVVDSVIIKDAAITTAKIANLAVNDAKIGSLSAGKITAGTLAADIVLGARIKTADTGARVELNSTGLKAYDSSNAQTVSISSTDGSVDIVGRVRTGTTGNYIDIRSTSGIGRIRLVDETIGASNPAELELSAATPALIIRSPTVAGDQTQLTMQPGTVILSATGTSATAADLWLYGSSDVLSSGWQLSARNAAGTYSTMFTANAITEFMEIRGKFSYSSSRAGLFTGQVELAAAASGFTAFFAETLMTEPWLVFTCEDSPARWCGLTDLTTSDYSVSFSANTSGFSQTFYCGFRGE